MKFLGPFASERRAIDVNNDFADNVHGNLRQGDKGALLVAWQRLSRAQRAQQIWNLALLCPTLTVCLSRIFIIAQPGATGLEEIFLKAVLGQGMREIEPLCKLALILNE